MKDIDAVLVHYWSSRDLTECMRCLHTSGEMIASVTVVDNDGREPVPPEIVSAASVLRLDSNVGFARAANVGAARGTAQWLLFVNPDVRFGPSELRALRDAGNGERVAAVGPCLLQPDRRLQVGAAGSFPSFATVLAQALPLVQRLPGAALKRSLFLGDENGAAGGGAGDPAATPRAVDWVSGALLLAYRPAFEAIGGFDERYFMYGEDIDLCRRFHEHGWQVRFCPRARALHRQVPGGADAPRHPASTMWLDGLDQYYRLHVPRTRRLLHAVAATGFALRALAYGVGLARPASEPIGAGRRLGRYARRAAYLALS